MTAQTSETLLHDGQRLCMQTAPLSAYLAMLGDQAPQFMEDGSDLWRGYFGRWEIVDRRLYLIELMGTLADGRPASLETLFPGYPKRVFAHWFSGALRVPQGDVVDCVDGGHETVHEQDWLLEVVRGRLVRDWVKHNSLPPDSGWLGDLESQS